MISALILSLSGFCIFPSAYEILYSPGSEVKPFLWFRIKVKDSEFIIFLFTKLNKSSTDKWFKFSSSIEQEKNIIKGIIAIKNL
jgi:hypothetical protein